MLCKIFPCSISGDAFRWFSQLQPGSLTSKEDIERAFLHEFLDDTEATREKEKNDKWDMFVESWQIKREYRVPRHLFDYIMAKGNEKYGSSELRRVDEADIRDPASASIDILTSTSTNGTTSTSIDGTTSTSTNGTTSTSIEGTTSTSTNGTSSTSSCPQDSADSTQKSTDVSSCDLVPAVDKEITMKDFLELEDEAQPENLDQNLEKKLDDDQHTSEKVRETSPEASIDR
ncbi:hypothetical protein F2Q70_00012028 [Brassica cretica]|uniref:Retrotransposon gag domain-containing protein n=1 Tax=Brassica cretica TaxID=69181 RepID=A0A8S9M1D3_BRACR|nr:hypothetical protein F2Q70_00012028 [Brassica cretica]